MSEGLFTAIMAAIIILMVGSAALVLIVIVSDWLSPGNTHDDKKSFDDIDRA